MNTKTIETSAFAGNLIVTGSDLFLGGRKIFTVPVQHHTMSEIRVAGLVEWEREGVLRGTVSELFLGTGTCCHGHLYKLDNQGKGGLVLKQIITIDTNVMDILPIIRENAISVLVVGYGCAGAGVRLVDMMSPRTVDIMPQAEFRAQFMPHGHFTKPTFRFDGKSIDLNVELGGWLADRIVNLNDVLTKAGVDIEKTMGLLEGFKRF
jgi:hypothetical protein